MPVQWRNVCTCVLWLYGAFWLACPASAQTTDTCQTFLDRGISCTHTPAQVGEWRFTPDFGNWVAYLPGEYPSIDALLNAWIQVTREANTSPTKKCGAGSLINLTAIQTVPGPFEKGTFPEQLANGSYRYEMLCTDTSLGYPVQQMEIAVISIGAERAVGCAPPQTVQRAPATGFHMCVGEIKPVVTLRDIGPVESGVRGSPRIIEATVTNAANNHAPMGDAVIDLNVLPPTGLGQAGRILNTTYPGQLIPAASVLGVTDRQGKTRSTFYWPQAAQQAPIQRVGALCGVSGPCEATLDILWNRDTVIGFFNGVANTDAATQKSVKRLEDEFGHQYKDSPIEYDWFYNQTLCGEGALGQLSCLEDVAEVFEQRSRELGGVFANRWESFWDILAGRQQQDTSFTGRLIGLLGDGGKALLMWVDGAASAMLNQLTSSFLKLLTLFIDSPTYDNQADHLARLTRYADEGSGLLLVAHSQGNLFVNSAVDSLKAAKPDAQVQVVHVAPASPTLRGDHVLTDIDLVINGLRLTGLNSVPNVNINIPVSKVDPTGHGFEPTYLDKARAAYGRTIGMINTGLAALNP